MCGFIAHFSSQQKSSVEATTQSLLRGRDAMLARGPDGSGFWHEPGVWLGHRRLSIVDLDRRADQPLSSPCGRYVIVFNGEIYNYRELRQQLIERGVALATTSDTEVIVALFAIEGEAMLSQLQGMFAFAIWDRVGKRAFIARDPHGIKPLYVGIEPGGVWVASQVKALVAAEAMSTEPDLYGQARFWLLGTVPEPRTWYRDITALPAGHCGWIAEGSVPRICRWHDVTKVWRDADHSVQSDVDVREHVAHALKNSVRKHLVADVPVGVFLSGGIDSGALAALMVELGARSLCGITISFDEFGGTAQDEVPVASQLAARYGIDHYVRKVGRDEFLSDLPRILESMDQPSIDGINTWYAAKAAAERGLKVVVSGLGGDELFLGYDHFRSLPKFVERWNVARRVPGVAWAAKLFAKSRAAQTHDNRWHHAPDWLESISGAWWLRRSIFAPDDLTRLMGGDSPSLDLHEFDPVVEVSKMAGRLPRNTTLALAQIESTTYMRNQLLRDSDWASMAHSVELRTPLVDSKLLEDVAPFVGQFQNYPDKRLLALAPERPLPEEIIVRRKTGFGTPTSAWLASRDQSTSWEGVRSWADEVANAYGARVGPN